MSEICKRARNSGFQGIIFSKFKENPNIFHIFLDKKKIVCYNVLK